jgi:hydroxymethylglutaryl-CoA lyase
MRKVKFHEVGLRDGIQNKGKIVPLETKIEWANKLMESGIDIIQLGSFVHPVKVPQMTDTDKLFRHFSANKKPGVIHSGLVLNEKGLERGMDCGVEMFCMGVSASNTHSRKNTGMESTEAADRIIKMAKEAESAGKKVQVSVQSAFGCGFEGNIPESAVIGIIEKYLENGLLNISLADTAGHGHPEQVSSLIERVFDLSEEIVLTCHFHNTYGLGIANCYAALDLGAEYFETSFGGLGGCPFTKVAAGNVATEDLIHAFRRGGFTGEYNLNPIIETSKSAEEFFGKPLEGYLYKTGTIGYEGEEI